MCGRPSTKVVGVSGTALIHKLTHINERIKHLLAFLTIQFNNPVFFRLDSVFRAIEAKLLLKAAIIKTWILAVELLSFDSRLFIIPRIPILTLRQHCLRERERSDKFHYSMDYLSP